MSHRTIFCLLILSLVGIATLGGLDVTAEEKPASKEASTVGPDPELYNQLVERSINYLRTQGQADDGSYSANAGPGITALVTTALIRSGRSLDDPLVAKSLKYLERFARRDGGIYAPESMYRNYETCITMMCLIEANRDGRYQKLIDNAERYIKRMQVDEEEGFDPSHPYYGGLGYDGKHKRPDGSNTGIFMDALIAAGRGADDPGIQRALIFMRRLQAVDDEHTILPNLPKGEENRGSSIYATRGGGESQAKHAPDGTDEENARLDRERGLRGYGTMTYMGIKSLIYAGLTEDDERVKAAKGWIARNYRLDANPGLGANGLFYYYHTFAKTLHVVGDDHFVDDKGVAHDWRRDLVETLSKQQNDDGSWINGQDRWMEGDPNLVTGYALLALSYCRPQ